LNINALLKTISSFIVYMLLFLLFYEVSKAWIANAYVLAFALVILLNLLFNRKLNILLGHYLQFPLFLQRDIQNQILEVLLDNLEETVQYQEVKKLLFEAFEKLLPNTAHAFYVWDGGTYYLSHYEYINQAAELPVSIEATFFKNIDADEDHFAINKQVPLLKKKRKALKKLNLTQVYIFNGHNQAFAFLLTTPETRKRLKRDPLKQTLSHVQKKAGIVLENTGLFIDLKRRDEETRKLIEVSQKVLTSLDIRDILDYILDALSSLMPYDAAVIFLLDDSDKVLESFSSRGYGNAARDMLKLKVGTGSSAGFVVQTKQVEVIKNVKSAPHYYAARSETLSQIAVPFLYDGTVLGVLTVESDEEEFFTQNEIELIKMFANLVAVAIYNARQVEIRLAKKALELELINAATVQKGLLLRDLPQIKNLTYTAENIPSKIVSGDLYDFQVIDPHSLAVAIGDVAGKGAPAALMMTLVLAAFRSQNKKEHSTSEVVSRLNDLLTQTTIEGKFTTFFYGIIQTDKSRIIYTNAGHNYPILVKANGTVQELKTGGIVMGFLDKQSYKQAEAIFEKGDIFVAFTDGVSETMDKNEQEFGEKRIIEIVKANQNKPVNEIKQNLFKSLQAFSNFKLNKDDLTIIIAKHE
jgi:phosphoserine phosphatase RsbU/P